jgi:uncharacterized protein
MMKVGIFLGEDCGKEVQNLLRALERRDIPASAFRLSQTWSDAHTDEIRHNFATISHAVFMLSSGCVQAGWFPFVAGFFMGRDLAIVLFDRDADPPSFLDGYSRFGDTGSLGDYLEAELLISQKMQRVEEARSELSAAGLAVSEASFAYAVDHGNLDAVRNFLRVGLSPDVRDETGVPLLVNAIRRGDYDTVELLVEHGADVNAVSEDRGNSPLMEAATRGDLKAVQALVEAGADPDLKTQYGQTALMLAIGEGRSKVVEYLLDRGATTDAVDYLGMTAVKYASLFRSKEILSLLGVE